MIKWKWFWKARKPSTGLLMTSRYGAEAGARGDKGRSIQLKSFCVEHAKNYDYLADLKLAEDDKKRAYILGTLIHEVSHHLAKNFTPEQRLEYRRIVQEETSPHRSRYCTDYVLRHEKIYNSDEESILDDDFCGKSPLFTRPIPNTCKTITQEDIILLNNTILLSQKIA